MIRFLSIEEVLAIHENQLSLYGGSAGLRDRGLLESALAMPESRYEGKYLHGNIFEMAAAYLFHLTSNHPFVDGNKRVGLVAALVFLELNDYECLAGGDELESLVWNVAKGVADKPAITSFFRRNCSLCEFS